MLSVKETEEMVCTQFSEKMKCKSSTATRHIERKHASFSYEKKKQLLLVYESSLS